MKASTRGCMGMQKAGGIASLFIAVAYLAAIPYFVVLVKYPSVVDPVQKVILLRDNYTSMHLMHTVSFEFVAGDRTRGARPGRLRQRASRRSMDSALERIGSSHEGVFQGTELAGCGNRRLRRPFIDTGFERTGSRVRASPNRMVLLARDCPVADQAGCHSVRLVRAGGAVQQRHERTDLTRRSCRTRSAWWKGEKAIPCKTTVPRVVKP
jgi:hypothetical protein